MNPNERKPSKVSYSETLDYKKLGVWEKGTGFSREVYQRTRTYSNKEDGGILDELRGTSISIPTLVAEGWGRNRINSYIRYLESARGKCKRSETLIILARELGFLPEKDAGALLEGTDELSRMLFQMIKRLKWG